MSEERARNLLLQCDIALRHVSRRMLDDEYCWCVGGFYGRVHDDDCTFARLTMRAVLDYLKGEENAERND